MTADRHCEVKRSVECTAHAQRRRQRDRKASSETLDQAEARPGGWMVDGDKAGKRHG